MPWTDCYSTAAADYSRFRPTYPRELFAYLATLASRHEVAWDCATGNGQSARGLRRYFTTVLASDASLQQLLRADPGAHLTLMNCRAEAVPLRSDSVDLVTVAQALHWFANAQFFQEVARVSRTGATIAAWTYPLLKIGPDVDPTIRHFHNTVVGRHWPPERVFVDKGYRGLAFPFDEVTPPPFTMTATWTLERVIGYVGTWSAVKRARAATHADPVTDLERRLRRVWGPPNTERLVTWPLRLRVGRISPKHPGTT